MIQAGVVDSKQEFDQLSNKIKHNSATIDDYYRYENVLRSKGYSDEQIWSRLKNQGIYSWEEYLDRRNKAQGREEKNTLEVLILGGLLGLGLALVLDGLFGNR